MMLKRGWARLRARRVHSGVLRDRSARLHSIRISPKRAERKNKKKRALLLLLHAAVVEAATIWRQGDPSVVLFQKSLLVVIIFTRVAFFLPFTFVLFSLYFLFVVWKKTNLNDHIKIFHRHHTSCFWGRKIFFLSIQIFFRNGINFEIENENDERLGEKRC